VEPFGLPRHNGIDRQLLADMTRTTLTSCAASTVLALVLRRPGVGAELSAYKDVTTIESRQLSAPKVDAAGNPLKDAAGKRSSRTPDAEQTLPMGPWLAGAIKELGTWRRIPEREFGASLRESHAAVELLEMPGLVMIPAALTLYLGRMVATRGRAGSARRDGILWNSRRDRRAQRATRQSAVAADGIDQTASVLQPGGTWKVEARLGLSASALFATHHGSVVPVR